VHDKAALIDRVASAFAERLIVPIIGAGCSATQTDDFGRTIEGFPLAHAFSRIVQDRYPYLKASADFYEANALLATHEGPGVLIHELVRSYSPARNLPAYEALSLLPFDTAVSFNFDESFEYSLVQAGRAPAVVVVDEEVPHSRNAAVTLVKPHGTASRGLSLRATRESVSKFDAECPLVRSLLEVLLAGRTALYIGYGFGDDDLLNTVRRVRAWSRASYRNSTAVVLSASAALRAELEALHIDVIEGDALDIIGAVSVEFIGRQQIGLKDSEQWRAHPFFRELVSIRGRPTETQVIEALLNATENRQNVAGVREAARQAAKAADLCLTYRPNFGGLQYVERELAAIAETDSDETAWEHWRAYRDSRRATRVDIFRKANSFIRGLSNILLYAQSQRVIELLLDIEPRQRSRMRLIVPECRAKSPEPFQNALLIAERLRAGGFAAIEFVVDVVALHLVASRQVDAVLMGVHKAYVQKGGLAPIAILNAVGTDAVCSVAAEANIPAVFILEDEKVVVADTLEVARASANFDPECDIRAGLDLRARGLDGVTFRQVGYDFVPWRRNMLAFIGRGGNP
jgi:translation initiation factor 2B subunit (eIF-2B alpha/beta/delta family)